MSTETRRVVVPELEEILGFKFPVLDQGWVMVEDYMGSDRAICEKARLSYGEGTRSVSDDENLIRKLLRSRHTSPFEMAKITLHVHVPMDAWRQWIRHRTANVNEYSTRYSVARIPTQRTESTAWRLQNPDNRQGSSGFLDTGIGQILTEEELELQSEARRVYEHRINQGVAREQARKDLPLSTYTEAVWTMDAHNLMHFLGLRMAPDAQLEIRSYANVIGNEIFSRWLPLTWAAFQDYRLGALVLSRRDIRVVQMLLRKLKHYAHLYWNQTEEDPLVSLSSADEDTLRDLGWFNRGPEGRLYRNRERSECMDKLALLGLDKPFKEILGGKR